MNEEQQIEEMAMSISECNGTTCDNCALKCKAYITCEILYDKDYRKVPDGAVILTPEERDELKAEIERLKKVFADQNELCWNCKKSVKEFAEKLEKKLFDKNPFSFKDLVDSTNVVLVTDIDELLKEYEE